MTTRSKSADPDPVREAWEFNEAARAAVERVKAVSVLPGIRYLLPTAIVPRVAEALRDADAAGYQRGRGSALELVALLLPLAKGYVSKHPHESSRRYIRLAEEALEAVE